jgi:ribonuclease Z
VSDRQLVVLGTASQVPTHARAHNAALLLWDGQGILFDPGEGTQRQLTFARIGASTIRRVLITHAHGDHCLGLPGVLQRLSLDGATHPVDVHFPFAAQPYVERLRHAAAYEDVTDIRLHPEGPGLVADTGAMRITAQELSHRIPALGWRVDEPDGRTLLPDRLDAAGVRGPDRSRLQDEGSLTRDGRTIHLDDVSVPRPGQSVAVVMDTRWCDGALALADGVDLLLVEATFLESERDLADVSGHLTAAQAARLGREAGARRVVLTHLSQRYPDPAGHLDEARREAPDLDLTVAGDLDRFALPARRAPVGHRDA